jgi:preprotein translocase subunit SecA
LPKFPTRTSSPQKLNEILPEAFAVVKNACRRLCGQEITVRNQPLKWEMIPVRRAAHRRHRPAQGQDRGNGHRRRQNARRHLPVYLNALTGRGVHVVTVNDYLAARDANGWARFTNFSA